MEIPSIQNIGNEMKLSGVVSGVTKSMVGLGNVDNTSDSQKASTVGNAIKDALDLKAPKANPAFSGTVTGITNIDGGAKGDLLVQDGIGITNKLGPGTNGYLLETKGANILPGWKNPTDITVGNATTAANLKIVSTTTGGEYFPTFVDGTGDSKIVRSGGTLKYNPSTNVLSGVTLIDYATTVSVISTINSTSSGTFSLPIASQGFSDTVWSLTADATFNLSGGVSGGIYNIIVTVDATSRTITKGNAVLLNSAVSTALNANSTYLLTITTLNSSYYCNFVKYSA